MAEKERLEQLAKLIRYYILVSTTQAGSGHPTSALSATDLLAGLFFGGIFRCFPDDPGYPDNDRLIFSKGHASPLLYSLWAAAGKVSEDELMTYRHFGSLLEGHPTPAFSYAEAATGSLGQGLAIGVGMAMNAKYLDKLPYRTYVLLGDSEMSEGSQWESIQLAAHYELSNLIGILDVNRLGQRGETMYGHNLDAYRDRISAFGWETIEIQGHDFDRILPAFQKAFEATRPVMIIAYTIKGKGVSFLEDKNGWHGKALNRDQLDQALKELGPVDRSLRGEISEPVKLEPGEHVRHIPGGIRSRHSYETGSMEATRKAYGNALLDIFQDHPDMVVLDAEVSNSTFSEIFRKEHPERFFEMYIAEQNMVGAALGMQARGKLPFVSTFAAFLSRAYDQIRMCQYSDANIKFCGSHAGVSIGQDGPSQMGLEDIAMFRSVLGSTVFYPCDAVSTAKLVETAASRKGIVYIRTTREKTPVIYGGDEKFPVGGNKLLRKNDSDTVSIVAAGATVFEALKAREELKKEGINARVIDLYCVKPINHALLMNSLGPTRSVVTVEDHHAEGGIGEAVRSELALEDITVHSLAVRKIPKSGKPEELLDFEEISSGAIVRKARQVAGKKFRPAGLKTRIFLDGGSQVETREILDLLGFLDGQTTNPTLFSRNPGVKERLEQGKKFSEPEIMDSYRRVVREISGLVPDGSVSVEVYADASTAAEEMLRMGREMFSWIPNAHIKFPTSAEGLKAAEQALKEGMRVNMTLCFSQQQAAAVYAATRGASRGEVFVSPFIGRLDDRGENGMDVIANIIRMYSKGDGHVEVLTASVRSLDHLLAAIHMESDIVTVPFGILREWAAAGMPMPGAAFVYKPVKLKGIHYEQIDLSKDWNEYDLKHDLTDKGMEKFSQDWNSLIEKREEAHK